MCVVSVGVFLCGKIKFVVWHTNSIWRESVPSRYHSDHSHSRQMTRRLMIKNLKRTSVIHEFGWMIFLLVCLLNFIKSSWCCSVSVQFCTMQIGLRHVTLYNKNISSYWNLHLLGSRFFLVFFCSVYSSLYFHLNVFAAFINDKCVVIFHCLHLHENMCHKYYLYYLNWC